MLKACSGFGCTGPAYVLRVSPVAGGLPRNVSCTRDESEYRGVTRCQMFVVFILPLPLCGSTLFVFCGSFWPVVCFPLVMLISFSSAYSSCRLMPCFLFAMV